MRSRTACGPTLTHFVHSPLCTQPCVLRSRRAWRASKCTRRTASPRTRSSWTSKSGAHACKSDDAMRCESGGVSRVLSFAQLSRRREDHRVAEGHRGGRQEHSRARLHCSLLALEQLLHSRAHAANSILLYCVHCAQVSGTLRVVLRPLLSGVPIVGGVTVSFLRTPVRPHAAARHTPAELSSSLLLSFPLPLRAYFLLQPPETEPLRF